jgi:hypothetical protein
MADYRSSDNRGAYRLPQHPLRGYGGGIGDLFDQDRDGAVGNFLSSDLLDLVGMVARSHPECPSLWRPGVRDSHLAKCQIENAAPVEVTLSIDSRYFPVGITGENRRLHSLPDCE